jgi:hypothetical protein
MLRIAIKKKVGYRAESSPIFWHIEQFHMGIDSVPRTPSQ